MSQTLKVERQKLAEPECHGEEIGSQPKNGKGGGGKESPIDRRALGYVAQLIDLKEGEGKCEEGRPDQRKGDPHYG